METDVEKLYRKYTAAWLTRDIEAVVSFNVPGSTITVLGRVSPLIHFDVKMFFSRFSTASLAIFN